MTEPGSVRRPLMRLHTSLVFAHPCGAGVAVSLLTILFGCRGDTPNQSDAAPLPAELPAVPTQEPVAPQPVRTACAQVAAMLRDLPVDSLTVSERIITDHVANRSGPGCRVRLDGAASGYGGSARPNDIVQEELPTHGWTEDFRYAADGPDGTAFALQRDGVTCLFQGMWDGGDDGDPTYIPKDWYALEVDCLESSTGP